NDAQLVELEAQLVQSIARSARPRLILQDGPIIFNAVAKEAIGAESLSLIRPGSLLRVRGICLIQGGENHEPSAFRLLVMHPRDIRVLSAPSWWTARHTFVVAATLTAAVLASLAWVGSLRRRVRQQTEEIRQKLEERNQFAASLEREKAELASTQKKLIDASRQAGMAEVATSVLHNVGNVLNSINISSSLMAKNLKDSKSNSLKKLAALITEHQTDLVAFFDKNGKGMEVPAYLERLARHLAEEQQALLAELESLQR